MDTNHLIAQGNSHREQGLYREALQCYALAFAQDPDSAAAFNNYGNVQRELGRPDRAIPFLQHAIGLDPGNATAQFNLAVAYLLMGDYARGWPQYESRWNFEHLAGTEPQFKQPRWRGEDLQGKTVLVVGEQGHGDNIQFVRFLYNLHVMGATIKLQVTAGLVPLLEHSDIIQQVGTYSDHMGDFDYWVPIMSIPGVLGITLDNMPRPVQYLNARQDLLRQWAEILGAKTKLRVGFAWSGRRDNWLNRYKGMPFAQMLSMIESNPQYQWINLQIDATAEEEQALSDAGVTRFPSSITGFHDTAALVSNLDVVVSVDTAIAHLAAALGRPTWIMIQRFATDWRWLLDRNSSPWYSTARIFRQPDYDDWDSVTKKIAEYLSWFKA
jgi:tetratricopeptide (TPR) repeat protein